MFALQVVCQLLSFAFTVFALFAPPYDARTFVKLTPGGFAVITAVSVVVLVCGGLLGLPLSIALIAYMAAYVARAIHSWSLVGEGLAVVHVWVEKAIVLAMGILLWAAGFYAELFAWAAG